MKCKYCGEYFDVMKYKKDYPHHKFNKDDFVCIHCYIWRGNKE